MSDPLPGYEQYGTTCGGRVQVLAVLFCTDPCD
jgi:hypothetical protein